MQKTLREPCCNSVQSHKIKSISKQTEKMNVIMTPNTKEHIVAELVDGVREELVDEVVESVGVDAADVHGGAFADRLEPFEDVD